MNEDYMECAVCGETWLDSGQDKCPFCDSVEIGDEEDGDFEGFEEED